MSGKHKQQDQLQAAYRRAIYKVWDGKQWLQWRIGEKCPAIDRLLARSGHCSAAFVTAFNPHSKVLSEQQNRNAQEQLYRWLSENGYAYLQGYSTDESESWPKEESALILGIDREQAICLGRQFAQAGICWIELDKPVRLLMLGKLS